MFSISKLISILLNHCSVKDQKFCQIKYRYLSIILEKILYIFIFYIKVAVAMKIKINNNNYSS